MKKSRNILTILLIFLITITIMSTVNADFNTEYYKPEPVQEVSVVSDIGNIILGAMQVIGTIVSVAILIMIGIKYMVGSVEEKASYKKSMIPYLVGATMLFAAATVVKFLYNIGVGFNNS